MHGLGSQGPASPPPTALTLVWRKARRLLSTACRSLVLHCLSISKAPAHPRVLGAGVAAGVAAGWGRAAVRSMSPAGRGRKQPLEPDHLHLWAGEPPGPFLLWAPQ